MTRSPRSSALLALLLTAVAISMVATGFRPYGEELPDGGVNFGCQYCHEARTGGGPRNAFGLDFEQNNHTWDPVLEGLDSDGDGFTNGEEFLARPVTNPGDASSYPPPPGQEPGISPSLIFIAAIAVVVAIGIALIWRKR